MTPRRTANLNPKGGGDKSMTVKRGASEAVYGAAPQRLGDTAKARLPEPQCPVAENARSSVARLNTDATDSHEFDFCSWYALAGGRWEANLFKGMSGEPKSPCKRSSVTEHGIA